MTNIEVICLENEAFYKLVDKLTEYVQEKHGSPGRKWISGTEAMELLGITSKATLQRYRDESRIRFTQPDTKIILYDRDSIMALLDQYAKGKL